MDGIKNLAASWERQLVARKRYMVLKHRGYQVRAEAGRTDRVHLEATVESATNAVSACFSSHPDDSWRVPLDASIRFRDVITATATRPKPQNRLKRREKKRLRAEALRRMIDELNSLTR